MSNLTAPAWVDAHAHICSAEMPLNDHELASEAFQKGCRGLVEVATDLVSLERAMFLQKQFPWVAVSAAVTPHEADTFDPAVLTEVEQLARAGDLQAVGETGLDYFHWAHTAERQKRVAARQLELAAEANLPLVIHCRDAFEDFFALLNHHYSRQGSWLPGMLHCFTGSAAEADKLVDHGWYVSISGVVTYKKSEELRDIVTRIPLERLLVETDAPWLAPQTFRGKVNRPALILETYQILADLKKVPMHVLQKQVMTNLQRLIPFKGWVGESPGCETP
jgi:TatD DNase family protein